MPGRTSTRGRGWPGCRRWTCSARCCSKSSGSSCRSQRPAVPLPASGPSLTGHLPAPAGLLAVDPAKLREAGLSWRKIGTLRDVAERLSDGRLNQAALSELPDDELLATVTPIPGIGPLAVQGAMLIALRREDVVLAGDLAPRKAVQAAYQVSHLPTEQEVLTLAGKWRPYRSLATSYLFAAAYERAEAPPAASPMPAHP